MKIILYESVQSMKPVHISMKKHSLCVKSFVKYEKYKHMYETGLPVSMKYQSSMKSHCH